MEANQTYETDLTDKQWAIIEPLIPKAKSGGRPRTTDMRRVVNATLYQRDALSTRCSTSFAPAASGGCSRRADPRTAASRRTPRCMTTSGPGGTAGSGSGSTNGFASRSARRLAARRLAGRRSRRSGFSIRKA